MALVICSECSGEVSDRAAACPKCGNPMATARAFVEPPTYQASPPGPAKSGGLKWFFIVPGVLFGVVMCMGAAHDPDGKLAAASFEQRKQECSAAIVSSMGHSTYGYADKAAYDAKVREKCDGLTLDGKSIGQ